MFGDTLDDKVISRTQSGNDVKIRILLVDDHKLLREGLSAILENESGMEIIAQASTGRQAIDLIKQNTPDVVIMDVTMPDINGIEATHRILANHPKIKIIGLTMHTDKRTVKEMLKAGAKGYLPKDCARDELARAVRSVMKDKIFLSPEISKVVTEGFIYGSEPDGTTARAILTSRELEILQLLAEGNSTKEIAYNLNISIKTVETHRKNISEKLGIHSVAELTKYALREGLTSLDF